MLTQNQVLPHKKRMALCIVLGLALGLVQGCTSKSRDVRAIQVHLSSDPVSLDPHRAEDGVALKVLSNTMEGLFSWDESGKLTEGLAASYEISPDGKTYRFKLRNEAKWSDGQPVTAAEFVAGFRRALSPDTAGKMADFFFAIEGAEELFKGKGSPEALGVSAPDAQTLVIKLRESFPLFTKTLALMTATPFRQDSLKDGKRNVTAPTTGAYRIAVYKVGEFILLEPSESYWKKYVQKEPPFKAPPVAFKIVSDESTASRLFQAGQLDVLMRVPALELEAYKAKPGVLRTDPFLATYYLAFNTRKEPFNSREARCSVSGAIARDELVSLLGTGEIAARSWVYSGLQGAIDSNAPTPARWRARYTFKKSVELGFDQSARNTLLMERVQAQLKSKLSLEIALVGKDWKSHIASLSESTPSIYRFGWLSPVADALPHLQVFTSRSAHNYTGWINQTYDDHVNAIGAMNDGPERAQRVVQAQALLVDEECVVVPLYHYTQTHAVADYISGFSVNPFGVIRLERLAKRR
jgi:oligopeptide transport system substrate-binding protein